MNSLLFAGIAVYLLIATFVLGVLFGDEQSFTNPRWGSILLISIFWLPVIILGLAVRLSE